MWNHSSASQLTRIKNSHVLLDTLSIFRQKQVLVSYFEVRVHTQCQKLLLPGRISRFELKVLYELHQPLFKKFWQVGTTRMMCSLWHQSANMHFPFMEPSTWGFFQKNDFFSFLLLSKSYYVNFDEHTLEKIETCYNYALAYLCTD